MSKRFMTDRSAHAGRSNDLIFSWLDPLSTEKSDGAIHYILNFLVCIVKYFPACPTRFGPVIILHLSIFPGHNHDNHKVDTLNTLGQVRMAASKHGVLARFNVPNLGVYDAPIACFDTTVQLTTAIQFVL